MGPRAFRCESIGSGRGWDIGFASNASGAKPSAMARGSQARSIRPRCTTFGDISDDALAPTGEIAPRSSVHHSGGSTRTSRAALR